MKNVFLSILTQLRGLNVFKNVYIYNNQIDLLRLGAISMDLPVVFVEIKITNPVNLGQKQNAADLIVRIHIAMMELNANDASMDNNISIFTYRDLINRTLIGFQPNLCGPISILPESPDYKHGNLYHYINEYKCHWIDTSAQHETIASPLILKWCSEGLFWGKTSLKWCSHYIPMLRINVSI